MRKSIEFLLIGAMLVIASSCTKMGLKSIRFEDETMQVFLGKSAPAPLVTDPADYDFSNLEWSSSDEYIAVVNDGYVTGIAPGYAEVTVKAGRKSARIGVYVTAINVTSFSVPSSIGVAPGMSKKFTVSNIKPSDATAASLKFIPSDKDNLSFSTDGNEVTVTASSDMKLGTEGSFTVSNYDGSVTKTVTVRYEYIKVTSVYINPSSLKLTVGESGKLSFQYSPSNATNSDAVWSNDNPSVVSLDESLNVTALNSGTATISAIMDGVTATCVITVTGAPIEGQSVLLTGSGNSVKLSVPGQSSVQWSSADTSIATVDGEGNVTGVSGGWVTITANYSGQTSSKEVRVVPANFKPVFYSYSDISGKKDWDGWDIYKLSSPLTKITMLPSTVTFTAYVGCEGYSLSERETDLLFNSKKYTVSSSGDSFYDLKEVSWGLAVHLYYKNSTLPGSSTVTVTAPNGNSAVINVTKNIGSVTISERNSMAPGTSVKVGGSFTVTSTGKYMFWVNAGDSYHDNQVGEYCRSQYVDSAFGYTLKSESSSLKLVNYSSSLGFTCINIDSSTPKGTYKLSVAEYPSVTFNVIYK